jgi:hypothetical protein
MTVESRVMLLELKEAVHTRWNTFKKVLCSHLHTGQSTHTIIGFIWEIVIILNITMQYRYQCPLKWFSCRYLVPKLIWKQVPMVPYKRQNYYGSVPVKLQAVLKCQHLYLVYKYSSNALLLSTKTSCLGKRRVVFTACRWEIIQKYLSTPISH